MKKFVILADSTCDLDESYQKQYDIEIVYGHLMLPDGTETRSYLKWESTTREAFYADLKKNATTYGTSPASAEEFAAAFEPHAAAGEDILCMTISSGISGTYDFTLMARESILRKYPKARIECVDSRRFGPGFGLLAVYAAMLRQEGKSLEEVVAWLEANKNRFHQAGWLDDLSFVARKGRLTHAKAFFGTLAGVKPIGEFDYNGMTTVIAKLKGAKAAYTALMTYIEKTIENPGEQIIFIAQTNRLPQAEEYKRMIEERFHPKAVYIKDVYPSCGINVGPGLMAAYYYGKPISSDLSVERGILAEFTGGNT